MGKIATVELAGTVHWLMSTATLRLSFHGSTGYPG